jgi:hypothetical protein
MPGHPLEGCRAKVSRARKHVDEFRDGVRTFTDRAPYVPRGEYDASSNEFIIRAAANSAFAGIPLELPLIAGDVAHQLRSALDHLVWQLVIQNTGEEPVGTKSGFPIFLNEAGYDARAAAMIAGVSEEASVRIRAAQPFHAGQDADRVWTWVLHQLNNTDKHRLIPVTIDYTFVGHVRMTTADGTVTEILPPLEEVRDPLHDGMEIVRVPAPADVRGVTVDVPFGFDIAFEQVAGLRRYTASALLIEMTDYVEKLIESFGGQCR